MFIMPVRCLSVVLALVNLCSDLQVHRLACCPAWRFIARRSPLFFPRLSCHRCTSVPMRGSWYLILLPPPIMVNRSREDSCPRHALLYPVNWGCDRRVAEMGCRHVGGKRRVPRQVRCTSPRKLKYPSMAYQPGRYDPSGRPFLFFSDQRRQTPANPFPQEDRDRGASTIIPRSVAAEVNRGSESRPPGPETTAPWCESRQFT